MEPDFIPMIPVNGLIKHRQIEPYTLDDIIGGGGSGEGADNYEYWKLGEENSGIKKSSAYGNLYNYYAATSVKGIAPKGWHLPTQDEWSVLLLTLDPDGTETENDAGGYLKETGTTHWITESLGAENPSGFNARGSGQRNSADGAFDGINLLNYYWEATVFETKARIASIHDDQDILYTYVNFEGWTDEFCSGHSIRLIRDNLIGWIAGEEMVDRDGNKYGTVKIGNQAWITSDLITEHFQDGTPISKITDNTVWIATKTEGMCYYNNMITNAYTSTPGTGALDVHSHDLVSFVNSETVQFQITPISDTEIKIIANAVGTIENRDNVQSDWDQTDENAIDFIKNKPELPDCDCGIDIVGETTGKIPTLGALYNYYTASSIKGICPVGWHLPTQAEFRTLLLAIDPDGEWTGTSGNDAGGHMKVSGTTFWETQSDGADNSTGFSAKGSGFRSYSTGGGFTGINNLIELWESGGNGTYAPVAILQNNDDYLRTMVNGGYNNEYYASGCSIRLMRDSLTGWFAGEKMEDKDNNQYETVKIGNQVWITENLITAHFNNGDAITVVTGNSEWIAMTSEAMCYYENQVSNGYVDPVRGETAILHPQSTLVFKDTDTISWDINTVSETEIQVKANAISEECIEQVQADWDQTDSGAVDFIKNKPDILEEADMTNVVFNDGGTPKVALVVVLTAAAYAALNPIDSSTLYVIVG